MQNPLPRLTRPNPLSPFSPGAETIIFLSRASHFLTEPLYIFLPRGLIIWQDLFRHTTFFPETINSIDRAYSTVITYELFIV